MLKNQPKRLGRGLSALISMDSLAGGSPIASGGVGGEGQPGGAVAMIRVDRFRTNRFQPRKEISPDELKTLADSIAASGVIQPVIARRQGDDLYELIAGERRWRAAQMAGLMEVPAIVRDATDAEMLELALTENIFREDLNAIDRATAYRRYCDEFGLSADDLAGKLGEDRSTVANYLRLLELPQEVKDWVAGGQLSMGHARCLLAIRSPSDLVKVAKQAMNLGLPVRALEKLVRDRVEARQSASKTGGEGADAKRPQIRALEEAFVRELGMRVEIEESRRKGSGKIVIHYANLDDFDRVSKRLGVSADT